MTKRVLVAPLNWGLGHATRCIPIIQELLNQGAEVVLASDGRAYDLLRKEFPDLMLENLPAYNILYQTNNMLWNMGTQSLKILQAIYRENQHLQKLIRKHQINYVIADNRFGCFSRKAKCIFITHQINIRLPDILTQWMVRLVNRFFMRQFTECWIPDVVGEHSIAGELSHTTNISKVRYVGILSRMQPGKLPQRNEVIVVLSGPEPQRTRLEQTILKQLTSLPYHGLLVRGKPEDWKTERLIEGNLEILPFLDSRALNEAIAASGVVICRSGYSSIMDLAVLGKKAIFIPTPGQTEQEYLAERLFEKGLFYFQKQNELNLAIALKEVENFPGFNWQHYRQSRELLHGAVRNLFCSAP